MDCTGRPQGQTRIGYVLVNGEIAMAAPGKELLQNPDIGRLFLGG